MPVWRLDEVRRVEGRFKAAHGGVEIAPLVGREDEAALLERCWQRTRGGTGQVVLISGQAGIGKSRLTKGCANEFWNRTLLCTISVHPFI